MTTWILANAPFPLSNEDAPDINNTWAHPLV
jgi:hypothetical protein